MKHKTPFVTIAELRSWVACPSHALSTSTVSRLVAEIFRLRAKIRQMRGQQIEAPPEQPTDGSYEALSPALQVVWSSTYSVVFAAVYPNMSEDTLRRAANTATIAAWTAVRRARDSRDLTAPTAPA